MRRFLLRLFVFTGLVATVFLGIILGLEELAKKKIRVRLAPGTTGMVLGHSHPECAYNDSLINNFVNVARSGEAYGYTLAKARPLLDQNPQLRYVWIEFTNNNLNAEMDEWTWGSRYILNSYPDVSPFVSISEKLFLAAHNPAGFSQSLSHAVKENFNCLANQPPDYRVKLGHYYFLVRDKTDSLVADPGRLNRSEQVAGGFSATNLRYLEKLVALCRQAGKKVVLVRSPQHPFYPGYKNEALFRSTLTTHFTGVEFLDFANFPASNKEFGDLEHLNFRGARKYSQWINALLESGLMEKKNKQAVIDSALKHYRDHAPVSPGAL